MAMGPKTQAFCKGMVQSVSGRGMDGYGPDNQTRLREGQRVFGVDNPSENSINCSCLS